MKTNKVEVDPLRNGREGEREVDRSSSSYVSSYVSSSYNQNFQYQAYPTSQNRRNRLKTLSSGYLGYLCIIDYAESEEWCCQIVRTTQFFSCEQYHTGWSKKRSPLTPIGRTSPGEKLMTVHWNITNSKFICRKSWSESLSLLQNRVFCKTCIGMEGIGICTFWKHLPTDSSSLWEN